MEDVYAAAQEVSKQVEQPSKQNRTVWTTPSEMRTWKAGSFMLALYSCTATPFANSRCLPVYHLWLMML